MLEYPHNKKGGYIMPKLITELPNNKFRLRFEAGKDENAQPIYKSVTVVCPKGKEEALQKLGELREKYRINPISKNINKITTLSEFIDRWITEYASIKSTSPSTTERHRYIRRRIDEALGHLPMKKILSRHLNQFILALKEEKNRNTGKPLSKLTIKAHHDFLKQIFSSAMEWDVIQKNPCKGLTTVKVPKSEKEIPSDEDLKKLFTVINELPLPQKSMMYLLLFTGIRRGELSAVKWDNLDFNTGVLHIKENNVKAKKDDTEHTIITKSPKTEAGVRKIQLTGQCLNHLKQLQNFYQPFGVCSDFMFVNLETKKPFHPDSITHLLPKLCKKADIKKYSPHVIRHWVCSFLIDSNTPIKEVQQILGHADATTTLNIYAHHIKRPSSIASNKMNNKFAQLTNKV